MDTFLSFVNRNRAAFVLGLLAAVLAVVLAYEVIRKSYIIEQRTRELAKVQADLLTEQGYAVAERVKARELEARLGELAPEVERLRDQLGRKATVREVVRWRTADVTVWPGGPLDPDAPPLPECADDAGPGGLDCPPVVVRAEGAEARLETREGNVVAIGSVDLVRVSPEPEERFRVPWESAELTLPPAEPTRVRWSVGPAVGLTSEGWVAGAVALPPPARVGRVELRPVVSLMVGPSGEYVASGGLVVGWRRVR